MEGFRGRWGITPVLRKPILAALAGPAAVTLLAIPEEPPEPAVVALLYFLAVVIAARVGGALAGVAASLLSFLALNFFFTQPLHTFAVGAPEDLISLFVFLVASAVVGVLLSSSRDAKAKAERRELEARLLNRLATRLLAGESTDRVLAEFAQGLCDVFDLRGCEIDTTFTSTARLTRGVLSGRSEQVRLTARAQDLGSMKLWTEPQRRLREDERAVIRSLATQLALALEGMRLSLEVRRAELEAQASHFEGCAVLGGDARRQDTTRRDHSFSHKSDRWPWLLRGNPP